jgi:hypothetical protein
VQNPQRAGDQASSRTRSVITWNDYLERRDPEFKPKMLEVLCVYREVKVIKETAAAAKQKPSNAVAIISYDGPCRSRHSEVLPLRTEAIEARVRGEIFIRNVPWRGLALSLELIDFFV